MGMTEKDIKRFFKHVRKTRGCWYWEKSVDNGGYGRMRFLTGIKPAHIVSWEIHNKPVPKGHVLKHTCKNPNCVNPKHLFLKKVLHNTESSDTLVEVRLRVDNEIYDAKQRSGKTWSNVLRRGLGLRIKRRT